MEVLAKRQRRRGQVRVLYKPTVAEGKRSNNCEQPISVKMPAGKLWGFLWGLKKRERGI